jgi:YARHG domain
MFGCTDSEYFAVHQLEQASCQVLWEVRNTIFKERGYCFRTAKAAKAFGNAGCLYDDVTRVPRNDFERANISAVKGLESSKGCQLWESGSCARKKHSLPASVVATGAPAD